MQRFDDSPFLGLGSFHCGKGILLRQAEHEFTVGVFVEQRVDKEVRPKETTPAISLAISRNGQSLEGVKWCFLYRRINSLRLATLPPEQKVGRTTADYYCVPASE